MPGPDRCGNLKNFCCECFLHVVLWWKKIIWKKEFALSLFLHLFELLLYFSICMALGVGMRVTDLWRCDMMHDGMMQWRSILEGMGFIFQSSIYFLFCQYLSRPSISTCVVIYYGNTAVPYYEGPILFCIKENGTRKSISGLVNAPSVIV